MVLINYLGRLGNNMLQYSAAKIFSNKFKIKLITQPISGEINFIDLIKSCMDKNFDLNFNFFSSGICKITKKKNILNLKSKINTREFSLKNLVRKLIKKITY